MVRPATASIHRLFDVLSIVLVFYRQDAGAFLDALGARKTALFPNQDTPNLYRLWAQGYQFEMFSCNGYRTDGPTNGGIFLVHFKGT